MPWPFFLSERETSSFSPSPNLTVLFFLLRPLTRTRPFSGSSPKPYPFLSPVLIKPKPQSPRKQIRRDLFVAHLQGATWR
ncbi:hypothetical protein RchiOBHm_Chr7g0242641 [Rosa chinensis]|uniref:Uncharacterized protein n=1 Tax=Rosa chinensis TaxID=74649 RepID=A0A2P6PIJ2_ROSCH|nr:hypothetical protein RchiOBHm_Chr7g0242641 [Rosa chinensis]